MYTNFVEHFFSKDKFMALTGCKNEGKWKPFAVDHEVYLCREAASRAAKGVVFRFFGDFGIFLLQPKLCVL